MWRYNPRRDTLVQIAHHDQARFGDLTTAATPPYNQDEETSGVIDVSSILGEGMYLTSDQAHFLINATHPNGFTNPDELVEGGQLLLMHVPGRHEGNDHHGRGGHDDDDDHDHGHDHDDRH